MLYRFFNFDLLSPFSSKSVVVLVSKRIRIRMGSLRTGFVFLAFNVVDVFVTGDCEKDQVSVRCGGSRLEIPS